MPRLFFNLDSGPYWTVNFNDIDSELRYLRDVVEKYREKPSIRNLAVDIIKNSSVEPKDKKGQAIAIGQYIQNLIYYVHELPERFQTPIETLRIGAGDCDDTTVLIDCLIESIGIPSALVCMKVNYEWAHIFPAAIMKNGNLLPLDSTLNHSVAECVNPVDIATKRGKIVTLKIA